MGMKMKPLVSFVVSIVGAFLAFSTIFNNGAYLLGGLLIVISIGALGYAIYELIHDEDWRIRVVRFKSRRVRKTKQAMQ